MALAAACASPENFAGSAASAAILPSAAANWFSRYAQIVSCERHDQNYDHRLRKSRISAVGRLLFRAHHLCNAVLRRVGGGLAPVTNRLFISLGAPVDQTEGPALAQIQLVVRKRRDPMATREVEV